MNLWKLGCRWGSGPPLFYDFIKNNSIVISWVDKDYSLNDYVLVTDGYSVLDIAQIKSQRFSVLDFPEYKQTFSDLKIPFNQNMFIYNVNYLNILKQDRFTYPLQRGITRVRGKEYIDKFKTLNNKYFNANKMKNLIDLLLYKKQIILQGPPGTGKTRLAEKIAGLLNHKNIGFYTKEYIKERIKIGDIVSGRKNETKYTIKKITDSAVTLSTAGENWAPTFSQIIESLNDKLWERTSEERRSNTLSYADSIAKHVFNNYNPEREESSDQIKLIQFHPSYTYEDFVRGIVAKPNDKGDGILYQSENKVIAEFAEKALENYLDSQKDEEILSYEKWIDSIFEKFIDALKEKLSTVGFIELTEKVNIISIEDDAFRYKGKKGWSKLGNRMLFEDIIQAIIDKNTTRKQLKSNSNLSGLAKWHASYYIRVVDLFNSFIEKEEIEYNPTKESKINEKNYVLIIDEINRANLSSVLGELIYALEYRGKFVESIYEVNGKNELVLPPNLYIIGTMNTADRSVGHIDYAIRRRFAFLDVLPKELKDDTIVFHKDIFRKVSELFIENYDDYNTDEKIALKRAKTLSAEFRPEDVWIGHSYFIQKKLDDGSLEPQDFRIRVDYEIKPILLEYVKDGVLTGKVNKMDIEDYIKSL